MGNVIGDILGQAIAVALSPVPIIAVILMLFTKRAKPNSLSFLLGWVLGIGAVGAIVVTVVGPLEFDPDSGPSLGAAVVKLVLGVLLLWLALRQWQRRPQPGQEPEMPKWMASIDSFKPAQTLGLGILLSAVNPKNLAMTIAASLAIAQAELSGAGIAISLMIFLIVASLSVAAPVVFYLLKAEAAAKTLDSWKAWLARNNSTVMVVLFLVFGIILIGKGIGDLA